MLLTDRKIRQSSRISNLKFEISRLELEIDYHQDRIRIFKERIIEYSNDLEKTLELNKKNMRESI